MATPQRLPVVNSDDGVWGDIIRQYLMKEHYDTGTDNAANGGHQKITVRAGTTAAATAPITLTSGALMTTPEAGAIEFLSDKLYFTSTTGPTRKTVAAYDTTGATGDTYYRNSGGDLTRLAIGGTGDFLTIASGAPSWTASIVSKTLNNTNTVTLKSTNFTLQDNTDTTKQLQFVLSSITTATTRTLTVPDTNMILVGTTTAQTLTNKTLTSPVINTSVSGSAVATLATASTLALRDTSANLTANAYISGFTTTPTAVGTTIMTIASTGVQVFTGSTTQTVRLPTTSIAAGAQYTIINSSNSVVTVQSSGANTITVMAGNTTAVFTALIATPTTAANWNSSYVVTSTSTYSDASFTLQDNGDATKQLQFQLSSITAGTMRTLTAPNADTTIVGTDVIQTLTNKTLNLANNTLTTTFAQLNTALSDATLGTTDTSQTLTNKTINAASNTITNLDVADFAGAAVITASEGITSNSVDTAFPTSAAVKSYVDGTTGWVPVLKSSLVNTVPVYVTLAGWNFSNGSGQQIHITVHIGSGSAGAQVYLEHKQGTLGAVAAFGSGINNLISGGVSELAWWADAATSTIYLRLTMSTTSNDWRNTLIEVANSPAILSSTSTTEPVGASWVALSPAVVSATRSTAETLTNKTLTAPVLGGTITGTYTLGGTPTFPATVVTTTGSQTLTNKTVSLASNIVTGTTAQFNAALSDNLFATQAGSETLTNKTINGPDNTLTNIAQSSVTNLTTDLAGKAATSHTHTAANISDSTTTGRAVLTATDAAAARTAIGAGTGSGDVTLTGAQTLTNKAITPRVTSISSSATPSINTNTTDTYVITALATNITSLTVSGTPTDGQKLMVRIKDNGTARSISWSVSFQSGSAALPTGTVAGKTLMVGLIWDGIDSKWTCEAVGVRDYVAASQVNPYDLCIVGFGTYTARVASSYGDFPFGVKLQRAVTFTSVTFRVSTADASGNLVVELRKNGTTVSGTSTTIAAASQVAGGTSTGSWSFAAGDILTVFVTGVGTTPGVGLIADIKGAA